MSCVLAAFNKKHVALAFVLIFCAPLMLSSMQFCDAAALRGRAPNRSFLRQRAFADAQKRQASPRSRNASLSKINTKREQLQTLKIKQARLKSAAATAVKTSVVGGVLFGLGKFGGASVPLESLNLDLLDVVGSGALLSAVQAGLFLMVGPSRKKVKTLESQIVQLKRQARKEQLDGFEFKPFTRLSMSPLFSKEPNVQQSGYLSDPLVKGGLLTIGISAMGGI